MEKQLITIDENEFRKGYRGIHLDEMLNTICSIVCVLGEKNDQPDEQLTNLRNKAAKELKDDMMVISAVTNSIKIFGGPKSLIFITEGGQAIDLINIKGLKENEIFDQILDNVKTH